MAENITRNHELNNLNRRDKFSHGTRGADFQGSDPEVAKNSSLEKVKKSTKMQNHSGFLKIIYLKKSIIT